MQELDMQYKLWVEEIENKKKYIVFTGNVLPDLTREEAYDEVRTWDAYMVEKIYDVCKYLEG